MGYARTVWGVRWISKNYSLWLKRLDRITAGLSARSGIVLDCHMLPTQQRTDTGGVLRGTLWSSCWMRWGIV